MSCQKKKSFWLNGHDGKQEIPQNTEQNAEWPGITIHSAKFNKFPGRTHYLVTVDDKSNLRLWDWQ